MWKKENKPERPRQRPESKRLGYRHNPRMGERLWKRIKVSKMQRYVMQFTPGGYVELYWPNFDVRRFESGIERVNRMGRQFTKPEVFKSNLRWKFLFANWRDPARIKIGANKK